MDARRIDEWMEDGRRNESIQQGLIPLETVPNGLVAWQLA